MDQKVCCMTQSVVEIPTVLYWIQWKSYRKLQMRTWNATLHFMSMFTVIFCVRCFISSLRWVFIYLFIYAYFPHVHIIYSRASSIGVRLGADLPTISAHGFSDGNRMQRLFLDHLRWDQYIMHKIKDSFISLE